MKTILKDSWHTWEELILSAEVNIRVIGPYLSSLPQSFWESERQRSVYTCFDAKTFLSGGSSLKLMQDLLEQGISLYHVPHLHAKMLVVDDKLAHLGSQNFTHQGRRNREAGCELSDDFTLEWGHIKSFLGELRAIELEDIFRVQKWLILHKYLSDELDIACEKFNPLPESKKLHQASTTINTSPGTKTNDSENLKTESEHELDEDTSVPIEVETVDAAPPHQLPFTTSVYFERPLMMVLKNYSGCTRGEALYELQKIVDLVDGDYEKYTNGSPKWENIASRARVNLIQVGYMGDNSDNCWQLTELGWEIVRDFGPYSYPCFLPGREPKINNHLRENEIKAPLLKALADLGGIASRKDVFEHLELQFSDRFHEDDFTIQQNSPRWQVITSTTMYRLKKDHQFISTPKKGTWALTQKGWDWVNRNT